MPASHACRHSMTAPFTVKKVTGVYQNCSFALPCMQVQVAVVETGLGGLKDATNVIEPEDLACAVITAIDLEHLQALGPYNR